MPLFFVKWILNFFYLYFIVPFASMRNAWWCHNLPRWKGNLHFFLCFCYWLMFCNHDWGSWNWLVKCTLGAWLQGKDSFWLMIMVEVTIEKERINSFLEILSNKETSYLIEEYPGWVTTYGKCVFIYSPLFTHPCTLYALCCLVFSPDMLSSLSLSWPWLF